MRSMALLMRSRHWTCALLVDDVTLGKPLERERLVEWVRRVLGDGMREDPARAGRRLEAAVAPAAVDIEIAQRRPADDGAAIHRHIHDAPPMAHEAQPAEARKERDQRRREIRDR